MYILAAFGPMALAIPYRCSTPHNIIVSQKSGSKKISIYIVVLLPLKFYIQSEVMKIKLSAEVGNDDDIKGGNSN